MLTCPQFHHHSPLLHHHPPCRHPNFTTVTITPPIFFSTISCSSFNHKPSQIPQIRTTTTTTNSSQDDPKRHLRKHNAKSTSFLLHNLSPNTESQTHEPEHHRNDIAFPEEDKIKLLELSLTTDRIPLFPGSVYTHYSRDANFDSSPVNLVIKDDEKEEEEGGGEMIMRAIEIRRKVTREIFKQQMRRGKFGITYVENMVDELSEFIDYVMIEAAKMKGLEEFSQSSFNVRARTVIEDSGAVPLIRWLKHNSLSYPQIAKLLCMSKGNLESIRRYVSWLKKIYVKGRFIGVALTKAGHVALDRGIEGLDENIDYLEDNGVRREWMGYIIGRCPQLLCYCMEELKSRVGFYTGMGMNEKDFGTMVFDYPKVLGYFTMEEMNEKVSYLKEFGLSNEDLGRLLAFKPQLMGCSIEERWKPLIKYLYYLGICRDGMKRILIIKPMVYCVDLEATIVPKVRFLQDIGIRDDAIGNMLVKFPPLLTYSLYKKIRPVVIFLIAKAGVSQRDIAKVIALGPELLGCSIANKLEVNLKYLLSLGIPLQIVGEMIADFPMLLRYNTDLLRPKYRYLRRTMVRPLKDLIEFPRFFSYSLEGRIIPRYQVMVANRVNFKLRYMLASTDEEFNQRVAAAVERRQRFESGIVHDDDMSNSQTTNGSVGEEVTHSSGGESTVYDLIDERQGGSQTLMS